MRDLIRIFLTVTIFFLPAAAIGADLEKGLEAYNSGDYETSLAECQPLADEGDAMAQYCVGRLYANGFGVPMDDALALKWYGLAAEQGHMEAQFNLGVMHANGWGVPIDDEEAEKWFRLAAEQGVIQAQTTLASICKSGRGIEKNMVEAYMWYTIAAELGDLDAAVKRDDIATKLTEEDLRAARQKVDGWLDSFARNSMHAGRNN